jgi:hypothetical protein
MSAGADLLWKKYDQEVSLYKSYLELLIKLNIFYYAITGAIVSFCLLHKDAHGLVQYALLLPVLMSGALAYFYFDSRSGIACIQNELKNLAEKLGLESYSLVPELVDTLLFIFGILASIILAGLLGLLLFSPVLTLLECFK